ncbi:MAG: DUF6390 family protein [Candidatus Parcubacteria bacterium]|nr:DUF6390 family protein [Candidatus Parcubacteria bacterium]
MNGILRCSRYAFGPNRLHYCGPDKNSEIFSHISEGEAGEGLTELLTQFETMYPYLSHIAEANNIQDPLSDKVVEAYWIGNSLLERVSKQKLYEHLRDKLRLKDKLGAKSFDLVTEKIGQGALPHHSFHVLDIWKRTGKEEREHSIENISECLVQVGKIISVSGPFIIVETEPVLYEKGKLTIGMPIQKNILRQLESDYDIEQLKSGDLVSIHWSVICEKITQRQAENLRKYTKRHIELANETL